MQEDVQISDLTKYYEDDPIMSTAPEFLDDEPDQSNEVGNDDTEYLDEKPVEMAEDVCDAVIEEANSPDQTILRFEFTVQEAVIDDVATDVVANDPVGEPNT